MSYHNASLCCSTLTWTLIQPSATSGRARFRSALIETGIIAHLGSLYKAQTSIAQQWKVKAGGFELMAGLRQIQRPLESSTYLLDLLLQQRDGVDQLLRPG